jgi:two-component system, NtrC family, sensor kinase
MISRKKTPSTRAQQAQGMAVRKKAPPIGEHGNAELATELKRLAAERDQALARERALAEVLQVINSSAGDLAPVFDTLLDRALLLCEAPFGVLFRYDGAAMHLMAMRGDVLDKAGLEWFRTWVPTGAMSEIVQGAPLVHIEDMRESEAYRKGVPSRVRTVEVTGARTMLWVPLRPAPRRPRDLPPRGAALHRGRDCAAAKLRRAGGHRDR